VPRTKSSDTITHRIELGSWERTHLDPVLNAQALDKYSEALGYLLDWKKLYLLITLIEMATGLEILWGTPNDLGDIIEQVRDWWKANKEEFGEEGLFGYINSKLGWGREMTPEQAERIQQTGELWANAFGTTLTGEPYTAPGYSSPGAVWAAAAGSTAEYEAWLAAQGNGQEQN